MLTAAIYGCGFIADAHADALRALGIPVVAVVGRNAERVKAFAAAKQIPTYGTDTALLEKADCVHICTPPTAHYTVIAALLQKGKHIVCEKPLCLSPAEADKLAALAAQAGTVCAVGFNVRYHAACRRIREVVQAPDFGQTLLLHGSYLQEFGASPARFDWRYDPSVAGEMHAVTEIGSHWLDLAQYLSGVKITAVSAQFDRFHTQKYTENGLLYTEPAEGRTPLTVAGEDTAILNLRFENGAIGCVTLSEVSHGRQNRLSLELTGEHESVWWNSEESNRLCRGQKGCGVKTELFAFANGFADTLNGLISAVYQRIAYGGFDDYPTFRDGADNVRLCAAALRSAQTNGQWVTL